MTKHTQGFPLNGSVVSQGSSVFLIARVNIGVDDAYKLVTIDNEDPCYILNAKTLTKEKLLGRIENGSLTFLYHLPTVVEESTQ